MTKKLNSGLYFNLLKLCMITLIGSILLKSFGSSAFDSPIFHRIEGYSSFRIMINCVLYSLNSWLIIGILSKRIPNLRMTLIIIFISGLVDISYFLFDNETLMTVVKTFFELLFPLIFSMFITKHKKRKIVYETIVLNIIIVLFQLSSLYIRSIEIRFIADNNLLTQLIFSVDFYIMLTIVLLLIIKKGGFIYGWLILVYRNIRHYKRFIKEKPKQRIAIEGVEDSDLFLFIVFTTIITIFQALLVFAVCFYIKNTIIITIIIMISFFVMRKYFGESFHSKSIISCTFITVFTFSLATLVSFPLYISVFSGILAGTGLSYVMYKAYHYEKYIEAINKELDENIEETNQD